MLGRLTRAAIEQQLCAGRWGWTSPMATEVFRGAVDIWGRSEEEHGPHQCGQTEGSFA